MSAPSLSTLQGVLANLARAWNAGDGRAYAGLFTTTASYVSYDGHVLVGRQAIEEVHQFLFDGPLQGSQVISEGGDGGTIDTSALLGENIAVVVSTGGIRLAGQSELGDRDSVQTLVLTCEDDRWLVAAFQNTRKQADS